MFHDIYIFVLFVFFSFGALFLIKYVFEINEYIPKLLVVFLGMILVVVFTKNAWLLFAYLVLVKALYSKSDIKKNLYVFIFLFPLLSNTIVVPFLAPGSLYFIDLTFQRALILVFLLPLFFVIRRDQLDTPRYLKIDILFIALLIIFILAVYREQPGFERTLFFSLRVTAHFIIDMLIPYFIITRCLTNLDDWIDLTLVIVFSGVILALSGMGEAALSWKFYNDIALTLSSYNTSDLNSFYEFRGGVLRISASLVHPITYGFVMTFMLGLTIFLASFYRIGIIKKTLIYGPIIVAILATGSRGAAIGMIMIVLMSLFFNLSLGLRRILIFVVTIGVFVTGIVFLNPSTSSLDADVTNVDEFGTFEYRKQLALGAIKVIPENLFFGTAMYREHPVMKELIQGQGIVDLVNGYAHITLEFGLIALLAFLFLIFRSFSVGGRLVQIGEDLEKPEYKALGVAIAAITLALSLQFAFTSFGSVIAAYFWILFAFSRNIKMILNHPDNPDLGTYKLSN